MEAKYQLLFGSELTGIALVFLCACTLGFHAILTSVKGLIVGGGRHIIKCPKYRLSMSLICMSSRSRGDIL